MAIGPSKGVNPLNEEPLQTEHVALRMAQRHLTEQEIDYVMLYGKLFIFQIHRDHLEYIS